MAVLFSNLDVLLVRGARVSDLHTCANPTPEESQAELKRGSDLELGDHLQAMFARSRANGANGSSVRLDLNLEAVVL